MFEITEAPRARPRDARSALHAVSDGDRAQAPWNSLVPGGRTWLTAATCSALIDNVLPTCHVAAEGSGVQRIVHMLGGVAAT